MFLKYVGIVGLALTTAAWAAGGPASGAAGGAGAGAGGAGGAGAAASAPSKAPLIELTPAVRAAIKQLSAEDFAVREHALSDLEVVLGRELRSIADVSDPETQARVNDLLTFQEGLCAWIKDVLKHPPEEQQAAFDFGLQPEVLPHVAHLYAKETNLRLQAVKSLRQLTDPHVADLLAKAIDDRDQQVYVAAMEGVYDRPPTDAVVEALWNRAVAAQFATFHQQQNAVPPVVYFQGRQIPALNNGDNDLYLRTQDNALATDVLVHLKPPQLLTKIKALFAEAERAYTRKNPNGGNGDDTNVWMYMPSQEAMRNAIRIAAIYQAPELVPGLYRIATGPILQETNGQGRRGQLYFWSNRTWAMALALQLSGQSPADFNLRTVQDLQGLWTVPTKNDEAAAVIRLRDWWNKEHDKYGEGADTRPMPVETPEPEGPQPGPIMKPLRFVPLSQ